MARLVGIVDAVAVLRPVHDAHIMVSHSTRVLAVFIITGAAAVLHRCLRARGDSAMALLVCCSTGVVLRGGGLGRSGRPQRWRTNVAPQLLDGVLWACFLAARSKIELASRDTLA